MTRQTSRVSLEQLSAFIDGELSADREAEVVRVVRHDPALQARLEDYREQSRNLHALYDPVLHAPMPDKLLGIARWLATQS